jgi:hypothetical protein
VDKRFNVPIYDRERAILDCIALPRQFWSLAEGLGILGQSRIEPFTRRRHSQPTKNHTYKLNLQDKSFFVPSIVNQILLHKFSMWFQTQSYRLGEELSN